MNKQPTINDWVHAICVRIADEWPGDDEDKKLLQECMEWAFTLCPAACRPLIGTGIIEADYFDELD